MKSLIYLLGLSFVASVQAQEVSVQSFEGYSEVRISGQPAQALFESLKVDSFKVDDILEIKRGENISCTHRLQESGEKKYQCFFSMDERGNAYYYPLEP